jgi:hypothetical protein
MASSTTQFSKKSTACALLAAVAGLTSNPNYPSAHALMLSSRRRRFLSAGGMPSSEPHGTTPQKNVFYFTDHEGDYPYMIRQIEENLGNTVKAKRAFRLSNGATKLQYFVDGTPSNLEIQDGWHVVFGGDAVDQYPGDIRVVNLLNRLYQTEKMTILLGNRDLNKLRIGKELANNKFKGNSVHSYSAESVLDVEPAIHNVNFTLAEFILEKYYVNKDADKATYRQRLNITQKNTMLNRFNNRWNRLWYILEKTMTAGKALENRRKELAIQLKNRIANILGKLSSRIADPEESREVWSDNMTVTLDKTFMRKQSLPNSVYKQLIDRNLAKAIIGTYDSAELIEILGILNKGYEVLMSRYVSNAGSTDFALDASPNAKIIKEDIFASFFDSVHECGFMKDLIKNGKLVKVIGSSLFVHGGLMNDSFESDSKSEIVIDPDTSTSKSAEITYDSKITSFGHVPSEEYDFRFAHTEYTVVDGVTDYNWSVITNHGTPNRYNINSHSDLETWESALNDWKNTMLKKYDDIDNNRDAKALALYTSNHKVSGPSVVLGRHTWVGVDPAFAKGGEYHDFFKDAETAYKPACLDLGLAQNMPKSMQNSLVTKVNNAGINFAVFGHTAHGDSPTVSQHKVSNVGSLGRDVDRRVFTVTADNSYANGKGARGENSLISILIINDTLEMSGQLDTRHKYHAVLQSTGHTAGENSHLIHSSKYLGKLTKGYNKEEIKRLLSGVVSDPSSFLSDTQTDGILIQQKKEKLLKHLFFKRNFLKAIHESSSSSNLEFVLANPTAIDTHGPLGIITAPMNNIDRMEPVGNTDIFVGDEDDGESETLALETEYLRNEFGIDF